MVWRALLAAVVVTCTFTRIHAQGPQRLDQIKDLLCVLILGGIQKEDLDGNTLQKLQRHNVNINDLNNEELQDKCRISKLNSEILVTTEGNVNHKTWGLLAYDNENRILNLIKNKEKANEIGLLNPLDESIMKYRAKYQEENNINEDIPHDNGEIDVNRVMKFWNDCIYAKNKLESKSSTTTQKTGTNNFEQNNKRDIIDSTNLTESDIITQVITNLLREKNRRLSQLNQQTKSINIYDQLLTNSKKVIEGEAPRESSNYKMINNKSVPNKIFRNSMQKIDRRFDIPVTSYPEYVQDKDETFKVDKLPTIISSNIIKDIAENVKAIILKDLRNELSIRTSTTTKATTPTKISITTERGYTQNISMLNNMMAQGAVLNNLFKLFEEMTALKNKPNLQENKINNNTKIAYEKKLDVPSLKTMDSLINDKLNTEKKIDKKFSTSRESIESGSNFNFSPQIHKYKSYTGAKGKKKEVTRVIRERKKGIPVTFQTNLLEIPPLGIFLDELHNPINQNIVLTTSSSKLSNPTHVKLKKNSNFGFGLNYYPQIEEHPKYEIRTNENTKYIPDQIQKTKPTSMQHDRNARVMKAPQMYENLEGKKIPEKTVYTNKEDCCKAQHTSQLLADCCNDRIMSRQQISINNMKKKQFNDSRYKKFMNSQQKVNEMLEQILSRNKFRSVEHV